MLLNVSYSVLQDSPSIPVWPSSGRVSWPSYPERPEEVTVARSLFLKRTPWQNKMCPWSWSSLGRAWPPPSATMWQWWISTVMGRFALHLDVLEPELRYSNTWFVLCMVLVQALYQSVHQFWDDSRMFSHVWFTLWPFGRKTVGKDAVQSQKWITRVSCNLLQIKQG